METMGSDSTAKEVLATIDGTEIDFGTIKKASALSVFDFRG